MREFSLLESSQGKEVYSITHVPVKSYSEHSSVRRLCMLQ